MSTEEKVTHIDIGFVFSNPFLGPPLGACGDDDGSPSAFGMDRDRRLWVERPGVMCVPQKSGAVWL